MELLPTLLLPNSSIISSDAIVGQPHVLAVFWNELQRNDVGTRVSVQVPKPSRQLTAIVWGGDKQLQEMVNKKERK